MEIQYLKRTDLYRDLKDDEMTKEVEIFRSPKTVPMLTPEVNTPFYILIL